MFKTFIFSVPMNYGDVFWHTGKGELFHVWNKWEDQKSCCLQDFCCQLAAAGLVLGIAPLISGHTAKRNLCAWSLSWRYPQLVQPRGRCRPSLAQVFLPPKTGQVIMMMIIMSSGQEEVKHETGPKADSLDFSFHVRMGKRNYKELKGTCWECWQRIAYLDKGIMWRRRKK